MVQLQGEAIKVRFLRHYAYSSFTACEFFVFQLFGKMVLYLRMVEHYTSV